MPNLPSGGGDLAEGPRCMRETAEGRWQREREFTALGLAEENDAAEAADALDAALARRLRDWRGDAAVGVSVNGCARICPLVFGNTSILLSLSHVATIGATPLSLTSRTSVYRIISRKEAACAEARRAGDCRAKRLANVLVGVVKHSVPSPRATFTACDAYVIVVG